MPILEYGPNQVREEGGARLVDSLPDVVGYGVGARGSRRGGFGEGRGDFFLADRKVVGELGEVDIRISRGRGGREKMIQEGCIDALRSVLVRKGREARLLSAGSDLFRFPHRGRREGGEVFSPVRELGLLYGTEVGPAG